MPLYVFTPPQCYMYSTWSTLLVCRQRVSLRHLPTHILYVASLLHLTTANIGGLTEVAIIAQTTHSACAVKLPLESLQGTLDIFALAYRYNDHIVIFSMSTRIHMSPLRLQR